MGNTAAIMAIRNPDDYVKLCQEQPIWKAHMFMFCDAAVGNGEDNSPESLTSKKPEKKPLPKCKAKGIRNAEDFQV